MGNIGGEKTINKSYKSISQMVVMKNSDESHGTIP